MLVHVLILHEPAQIFLTPFRGGKKSPKVQKMSKNAKIWHILNLAGQKTKLKTELFIFMLAHATFIYSQAILSI